jgi:hypothetical protein
MSVKINLVYSPEAQRAPQSFKDGLQKAATILENSLKHDNATVNIKIYYKGSNGSAYASPVGGAYLPYTQVRDILINHAGDSTTVFNNLPKQPTIQGASRVLMWNAQLKVLGLTNPNGNEIDGSATFGTKISDNVLVGVALHEFTHVLGRVILGPTPDIFNFFRFTAENTRLFTGGSKSAPAYFSVDNGKTRIADYGTGSDPGDFSNSSAVVDPFSEWSNANTLQTLTPLGLKQMEVLGYNINAPSTKINSVTNPIDPITGSRVETSSVSKAFTESVCIPRRWHRHGFLTRTSGIAGATGNSPCSFNPLVHDSITGSRVAIKDAPKAFVLDSSKGVNNIVEFNANRGDVLIFDQQNYQHTLELPDVPLNKGEISYDNNGFVYLNTNGHSEVIANLGNHTFLTPSNFAAI